MAKEIKYLQPYEKEKLFFEIDNDKSVHAIRNKAIFYTAKYCALRASEIGLIETAFFNPNTREIFCKRIKGGNNNTLRIIDNNVLNALTDYLKIRYIYYKKSPYLFVSNRGTPISRQMLDVIMKDLGHKANIPEGKAHMHVLRHTRAVELADGGLDVREIQYWLGHQNIRNTQIYMQFTSKQWDYMYQKLAQKKEP